MSGWDIIIPLVLVIAPVFTLIVGVTANGLELTALVQRRPPSAEWFNAIVSGLWTVGCSVWVLFSRFAAPFWHLDGEGLDAANIAGAGLAASWAIITISRAYFLLARED